MTNNTENKNQCDDTIKYESKFDNKSSLSRGPNKDPLPVVTDNLIEVKKHGSTIISGLNFLSGSGATENMIKLRHT